MGPKLKANHVNILEIDEFYHKPNAAGKRIGDSKDDSEEIIQNSTQKHKEGKIQMGGGQVEETMEC